MGEITHSPAMYFPIQNETSLRKEGELLGEDLGTLKK